MFIVGKPSLGGGWLPFSRVEWAIIKLSTAHFLRMTQLYKISMLLKLLTPRCGTVLLRSNVMIWDFQSHSCVQELIPEEKAAKVDNCVPVLEFLRFILVRDPNNRPSLDDVMKRLEELRAQIKTEETTTTHDMIVEELATDIGKVEEPTPEIIAKESGGCNAEVGAAQELLHTSTREAAPHGMRSPPDLAPTRKLKVPARRQSRFSKLWQRCCPCRQWKLSSGDG